MVIFLILKLSSRIIISYNQAVYLLNKNFEGWVIGATAPELCQKFDFFSWKKGWKKEKKQ